ncbi:MAG: GTPase, partial [Stenotrophomonas chelatiphaga]
SRIAPDASLAVGITRTDEHPQLLIPTVRDALFAAGFRIPVLRVDARSAAQVTFLVRSLLSHRYADS